MEQHTHRPDGSPADEVLTNAEWLYLLGELLDADLALVDQADPAATQSDSLQTLLDEVMEQHSEEVCDHCYSHLDGPKALSPCNPACDGQWCTEAVLSWLQSPCADPDTD